MLTAAVLATAVLGTTVNIDDGRGTAPAHLLNPRTLAPLKGSPRFPPDANRFDLSPDRKRVAILSGRYLRIYGLRSRKQQARVRIEYWTNDLTWITRNRILATGCERGFRAPCSLTAVDARRGRVLRRTSLGAEFAPETERVGKRWLLGVGRYAAPGVTIVVADANGRARHRIVLDDFVPGNLSGNLLADDGNDRVYAIDVKTGTRTYVAVPGLVRLEGALADGRQVITVQTDSGYERRPIDPFTLAVGKPMATSGDGYDLMLDRRGFLGRAGGPPYIGDDGDFTFTQYGFDGAARWKHTLAGAAGAPYVALGDYAYVGTASRSQPRTEAMHVLDLATGREVKTRPGFWAVIGRGDSGAVYGTGGLPD